jgi:hypothetical protein
MPASKKSGTATIDLPSISPDEEPIASIAPDSEEFDLETASLPDLARSDRLSLASGALADLPDLDLPSPRAARPRASDEMDLPDIEADLPDLGGDLPDLDAGLPSLDSAGPGLPSMDLVGFPQASDSGLPAPPERLPGLAASPGPPDLKRGADPKLGRSPFGSPQALGGPGEADPFASPSAVGGMTRSAEAGSFGEVGFGDEGSADLDEADEFDAFPTEEKAERDTAGGAAGYGDVTLDGGGGEFGGGGLDLGDEIDRGQVPEGGPSGPVAAASATVDLS